jgi:predicted transcriptional regulator
MLAPLKVKDYMSGSKITFTPDMDILRAIHQLIEFKISGAPVIDRLGNLIGFLSEKDCMKVALNSAYQGGAVGQVADFMHSGCQTIDVETSIIEAAEIFLNTTYKSLPVIKENRLVGSMTRQNILRALETTANIESTKKPAKQPTKQPVRLN